MRIIIPLSDKEIEQIILAKSKVDSYSTLIDISLKNDKLNTEELTKELKKTSYYYFQILFITINKYGQKYSTNMRINIDVENHSMIFEDG